MINLKKIINDNVRVKFDFFRNGSLWYSTSNGYQFSIPVNEVSYMTILKATDKASAFSYWIKKYFNEQEKIK